jgi:2-beta-glucuronyltransferase
LHYLVITAHHDYRTPRRSSIHFITDELAKRGKVNFFSLRYSFLSKYKNDIRTVIDHNANKIELYNGVECYLWKTLLHPFNLKYKFLRPLEDILFSIYEKFPSTTLVNWILQADVVIYESGIAPIYFELAKKMNPKAKHIYRGSDDLATINVSDYGHRKFLKVSPKMDALCLLSSLMAKNIPSKNNVYLVPNGLDLDLDKQGDPSPYGEGIHAISMGSMLFDPSFFEYASHAFPEITFHVVGSGHARSEGYGENVIVYGDMKYSETIRYIKHAHFGIAPYISEDVPIYLADSSLKMLQYDFFGLPTVCPQTVTGKYKTRLGYTPGNNNSIKVAIDAALKMPHQRSRKILSWSEVTDRLINPTTFKDTQI